MQDQDALIREARLLVSPAEAVFRDLKEFSEPRGMHHRFHKGDEFEKSLLARREPLIDLALAAFGYDKDVVKALYVRSREGSAGLPSAQFNTGLRLACLSNQVVAREYAFLSSYSHDVLGDDETRRLISEADLDEAIALIRNPTVGDKFLQALYTRKDAFEGLPEQKWLSLVAYSAENKRLVTNHDSSPRP